MCKQKIYFAGPLFCKAEKDYNLALTKVLEDAGYEVFLPQRDGFEAPDLVERTEEEKAELIFKTDVDALLNADIIFMVLDGRVPDEGACVELGIAYAKGKRCYGAKTDVRTAEMGLDLNPMLTGCFIKIFKNADGNELIEGLKEYLSKNRL